MSIATIVTRGYGSFGTIADVVTGGYSIGDNDIISDADAEKIAQYVWKEVLESSYQAKHLMKIIAAACAGEASGLQPESGTPTYKGVDGSTDRIIAKTDRFGNRTDVTLDGS